MMERTGITDPFKPPLPAYSVGQRHSQKNRHSNLETDRQADRQTDRQTDKQTDRQTERLTGMALCQSIHTERGGACELEEIKNALCAIGALVPKQAANNQSLIRAR